MELRTPFVGARSSTECAPEAALGSRGLGDGVAYVKAPPHHQLDLRYQAAVNYWFRANRPEFVYLVAGTVGGTRANSTRPAEFIYDNMMIHATVVHASHVHAVQKLLYLGSSCIYPRLADQPMWSISASAAMAIPSTDSGG